MSEYDLWVFGYGSLMWHPEFDHDEAEIATLSGYRRGFTMRSIHHRGTVENPGLVLALDAAGGASCSGLAFRVTPGCEDVTMAGLRERELVSYAYQEKRLPLTLEGGRQVEAVTYVIDPAHVQYCGALALEQQARIIATASGGRGPNADYLMNTHQHLCELGIEDVDISWLAGRVRELAAGANQ
ncbi:MAG: gamma-glutamylcyclotransferase [Rhodobacteraceae bacterium]|nr:gamma-glutamylcyclotransferase [Paracoccaceae bacterium]